MLDKKRGLCALTDTGDIPETTLILARTEECFAFDVPPRGAITSAYTKLRNRGSKGKSLLNIINNYPPSISLIYQFPFNNLTIIRIIFLLITLISMIKSTTTKIKTL